MYHRYARVSQGLPEGATDEWIVTEAANAGVLSNDPPLNSLRSDLGLGASMGLDSPADLGDSGESLIERRSSFSSIPEKAEDGVDDDELQSMSG